MEIVEDVDSCFPTPVAIYGPMSSNHRPLLPSVTEQPIISVAPVAAASQPSTPTTSLPSAPVAPSPPAPTASPPPVTDTQEEGASHPRSPDHGNLGHNYSPPSPDPRGRRSTTFSISKGCHLLSRSVELANYLKPLSLEKDKKKIRSLSGEDLWKSSMHDAAAANFITFEGLQRLILDKQVLAFEWDQLLVEMDQLLVEMDELTTRLLVLGRAILSPGCSKVRNK
nr:uncharacterized protein LOC117279503 [Nicotiana tomentosiformis]